MSRIEIMSRLGLAEPLVRMARAIERSNRAAESKQAAGRCSGRRVDLLPRLGQ
jgi:hypothetical protein